MKTQDRVTVADILLIVILGFILVFYCGFSAFKTIIRKLISRVRVGVKAIRRACTFEE